MYLLAMLMLLQTQQASPPTPRLDIVCIGSGAANKRDQTQVQVHDNYGNYGWGQIVGNRSVPFDDQVNLWIEGDDGRLRMPRTMLPLLRGGEDGWFKLKNVRMTPLEITATVAVNFMNKPQMRIDRKTGVITLSGKSGSYAGRCEAYDPGATANKF